MNILTTETIKLTSDEEETLRKAKYIICDIINGLNDGVGTSFIDEQIFPDEIRNLINAVLMLENGRIYSEFNVLNEDSREKISKVICSNYWKLLKDSEVV